MKAIEILCAEHRVIERVLTALETGTWMLSVEEPLHLEFFNQVLEFITGFADTCHHQKEEGILYKTMTEIGDTQGDAMVAAMLHEHELARNYTSGLQLATQRLIHGDQNAISDIVHQSRHYTALLNHHIIIEDKFVFPYAAKILSPEYLSKVDQCFEEVTRDESIQGIQEKFLSIASKLDRQVLNP